MIIPPKYLLTANITKYLQSLEASRQIVDAVSTPPEIEQNIRRQSTLKSSLFSARIEGNPLTLDDLPKIPSKDQKKREVYNILKALNRINQKSSRDLTVKEVLTWHETVTEGLMENTDSGKFRSESSAIFNSAGIAIYLPPPPGQVLSLMNRLLTFTNSPKESFVPVRACLAHYSFEKIHPFLDGNGRVGRLLLSSVLLKGSHGFKGLLSLEEYLDKNRSDYYRALESSERDVTDYLEFMLEMLSLAAEDVKKAVLEKQSAEAEDFLLPRRAEILNIIKDHKLISFDIIRRRFIGVNERTLRYDLKKLQEGGFIRKRGATKGVYYEVNSRS